MTLFERRILAALAAVCLLLSLTVLFLSQECSVDLRVVRSESAHAR
jgi:hypothetical protein